MDNSGDSLSREKLILNVSLAGSVAFLIAEIVCAWVTHSMSVLMDCVYDIADLVMIGPFLVLVPLLYKPTTEKRPYGYAQVESLFVLIKYIILLGVDVVLVISCIKSIAGGGNDVESGVVAAFEIGVSTACFFMFLLLRYLEKRFTSPAVKAELFIWRLDAMSTLGVGAGFLVNHFIADTSIGWVCPYVDPGIAIAIAVILAKEPVDMITESIRNLILFAPKKEIMDQIDAVVHEKCSIYGTKVTGIDVIKTGRMYWIEVYFDTDRDFIDVAGLKALDMELEKALEETFDDVWLEMIPDVEEFRNVTPARRPERRQEKIAYVEGREKKKDEKKQKKNM